ncbi:MAG TPA: hypothetical protein PLU46_03375 [Thiotrichales bacterium]|jgi:Mg-chelatase subunit ChlD|nr:hypothetical protein [Thiotrichales bacterium]
MNQKIYNLIILDESGSMGMIKESVIEGFKSLATKIISLSKEMTNQTHLVSLVTFGGDGVKNRLSLQPASELSLISDKTYSPDGGTPLYDAICKSVLMLRNELYLEKDYGVLVTIITDGEENASKLFKHSETIKLIESASKDSRWGFGLIGAGINLAETARSLSIPIERTIEFDHQNESVKNMFSRYQKAQERFSGCFAEGGDFDDGIPF